VVVTGGTKCSNSPGMNRLDQLTARTQRIHDLVRSTGGFLDPVGLPALTPDDWKTHFGPHSTATKNTYDPHRILS
jgi:cytokinin dehydrogenase